MLRLNLVGVSLGALLLVSQISVADGTMDLSKTLGSKQASSLRVLLKTGRVGLVGSNEPLKLSWKGQAPLFHVQNGVLEISGPTEVIISGTPLTTDVFLSEGTLVSRQWKARGLYVIQKGRLQVLEGEGDLSAQVQEGEAMVGGLKGALELESFDSKTTLLAIQGDIKLNQQMGTLAIEGSTGQTKLSLHRVTAKISSGAGSLGFTARQGSVTVLNFDGSVTGAADLAHLSVRTLEAAQLRLSSQAGNVEVFVPKKATASFALASDQGRVVIPKALRRTVEGTAVLRGALGGPSVSSRGSIQIKSQSGDVLLRVF